MGKIIFVNELLELPLNIPYYQRPYKWTRKNVADLLDDIGTAIADREKHGDKFRYRIGTIILHKENGTDYDIVDGQQRIITLSLIKYALNPSFTPRILSKKIKHKESVLHLQKNYALIKEILFARNEEFRKCVVEAFADTLETVVLEVCEVWEAFQLFDSQNTRGKELYPHDLLKAYHLREMNDDPEKLRLIREWERVKPREIKTLYATYLYPILKWAQKENYKEFTATQIETYKGVSANCEYTYAQRICKAMPIFQINESFCAGSDFFKMTDHYLHMLKEVREEINKNFLEIEEIIKKNTNTKNKEKQYSSTGFKYAVNLFFCALLFYYDRFHSFNDLAVKKLFLWAMTLRVDMQNLGLDTINKYALGDNNNLYTNHIPMFHRIANARKDSDIANLDVRMACDNEKRNDIRKSLYNELKKLTRSK